MPSKTKSSSVYYPELEVASLSSSPFQWIKLKYWQWTLISGQYMLKPMESAAISAKKQLNSISDACIFYQFFCTVNL